MQITLIFTRWCCAQVGIDEYEMLCLDHYLLIDFFNEVCVSV